MLRDGGTCDFALTVDDVDDAWREPGLFDKIGEVEN
jgi:hypothetical protein